MPLGRLLIINDNSSVTAELECIAESCGFATNSATNVEDFKESYSVVRPTLIILDLAVPQTGGIEVLRWLGSVGCTATVLIISGFGAWMSEAARLLGEARGLKIGVIFTEPLRVEHMREVLTRLSKES
jgi:DNA-binding response OmpR family regulator